MFKYSLESMQQNPNRIDWTAFANIAYGNKTKRCKLWLAGMVDKPASPIALKQITDIVSNFQKYIEKMAAYKEFVMLVSQTFSEKYDHKKIVAKLIETGTPGQISGALDGSVEVQFNCPNWLLTFTFKNDNVISMSCDD